MVRKIYYLEDNEKMGKLVKRSIEKIGSVCPVEASVYPDVLSFFTALKKAKPSLVIIDLMLANNEDGLEVLKEMKNRNQYRDIPVIVLSSLVGEFDRIICLEAGAATYYSKPFVTLAEINASVKNFLKIPKDDTILICGDLVIDSEDNMVSRNGILYTVMSKEFDLLKYFIKNRNVVLSKEQIYRDVWHEEMPEGSRTLDQHIKTLRQKVFNDNPDVIITNRKVGYKFVYGV